MIIEWAWVGWGGEGWFWAGLGQVNALDASLHLIAYVAVDRVGWAW